MKKVINPCTCGTWAHSGYEQMSQSYAAIRYEDGRLSICGVVGPIKGGNCQGSAGQCVDSFREGLPNRDDGWDDAMLKKFCDIWDEWHLNDMHPECEHQRGLGWREMAQEEMTLYHYILNDESRNKQKEAEKKAMNALKECRIFKPTLEQAKYANMKMFYDTYDKIEEGSELARYYRPYKSCIGTPEEEKKTRGWVTFGDYHKGSIEELKEAGKSHPKGILSKPCPVCGYKYGHGWNTVEVPKDVIDWLFALPDTTRKPAWV